MVGFLGMRHTVAVDMERAVAAGDIHQVVVVLVDSIGVVVKRFGMWNTQDTAPQM